MKTLSTGPELTTPHERQREVATLLARGFLRMRMRHTHNRAGDFQCIRSAYFWYTPIQV